MKENWFTRILALILYWWNKIFGSNHHPDNVPEIQKKDLQPADVLLFSADKDSWVSQAIIFLTDGKVSHSAIKDSKPDTLVHGVRPHVQEGSVTKLFKNRDIYVMRIAQDHDLQPVLAAAAEYVKNKEPFPMSTMYLLGLILVYKRFTPDDETQKWVILILRRVIEEIEEFIRQREHPGKLPMVCSQFVAQCYKKGNVPLKIKNGVILRAEKERGVEERNLVEVALDQLSNKRAEITDQEHADQSTDEGLISNEEAAHLLLDALRSSEKSTRNTLSPELIREVNRFGRVVHEAVSGDTLEGLPADSSALAEQTLTYISRGLEYLQDNEMLFVTPVDLLMNCPTLKLKGVIKG